MSEQTPDTSSGPGRDERRIRAAQDVLRTTIRDLYLGHYHHTTTPGALTLQLSVRVEPDEQWRLTFDPPLLDQLMPQLADTEAAREVFVTGHVFCFRCANSRCEHARPQSPLQVFGGYDATGRPVWQEFVQTLIDAKDERIDGLYAKPARLVALFQYGRELKGKQLLAFGKASRSYSILAQVVAGYFDFHGERLALSLQIVEGRNQDGTMSLRLNPVGHGLDEASLMAWLALEKSAVLLRCIQIAGRELERIEERVQRARAATDHEQANALMGQVPGVVRRLTEFLMRGGRQEERRTRHVEIRRKDQRPVHKALEDALAATAEDCYFDAKADTLIVTGDRGRVHAFNAEGRHVTSFMIKPGAADFRVRTGRWRPATVEEWRDFSGKMNQRVSHEQ